MRSTGIVLPIFSLTGEDGIGTLGEPAYKFIDFLFEAGQQCWQVLPINHFKDDNSPYSCYSIFAGNIYFIDLKKMVDIGILDLKSYKKYIRQTQNSEDKINYKKLKAYKLEILKESFEKNYEKIREEVQKFRKENIFWVEDYAIYMSLKKNVFEGNSWEEWDNSIKIRKKTTVDIYSKQLEEQINFYVFLQYLFFSQWSELRRYANAKNIKLIGEFPLYCDKDSCEVWARQNLFDLNQRLHHESPAVYQKYCFDRKATYNIDNLEKSHYHLLTHVVKYLYNIYDEIIIDNFDQYNRYKTVAIDNDGKNPKYIENEGIKNVIFRILETVPFSLGVILNDIDSNDKLVSTYNRPVIRTMTDGFSLKKIEACMPHNYVETDVIFISDYVFYPLRKWFRLIPGIQKIECKRYFRPKRNKTLNLKFIIKAYQSSASKVLVPMQDILNIGRKGVFLRLGKAKQSWSWRLKPEQLNKNIVKQLSSFVKLYGRN